MMGCLVLAESRLPDFLATIDVSCPQRTNLSRPRAGEQLEFSHCPDHRRQVRQRRVHKFAVNRLNPAFPI